MLLIHTAQNNWTLVESTMKERKELILAIQYNGEYNLGLLRSFTNSCDRPTLPKFVILTSPISHFARKSGICTEC